VSFDHRSDRVPEPFERRRGRRPCFGRRSIQKPARGGPSNKFRARSMEGGVVHRRPRHVLAGEDVLLRQRDGHGKGRQRRADMLERKTDLDRPKRLARPPERVRPHAVRAFELRGGERESAGALERALLGCPARRPWSLEQEMEACLVRRALGSGDESRVEAEPSSLDLKECEPGAQSNHRPQLRIANGRPSLGHEHVRPQQAILRRHSFCAPEQPIADNASPGQ
jgi:hypothetical protein